MSRCKAETNGGGRCKREAEDDGLCYQHGESKGSESVSSDGLSPNQVKALESLVARGIDQTLEDVAERAGVSVRTLYRYMRDETFVAEYRSRVEDELGSHRSRVARALVEGACSPGRGQASMQRMYWQRLGELTEKHEVTGADGAALSFTVKLEDDDE